MTTRMKELKQLRKDRHGRIVMEPSGYYVPFRGVAGEGAQIIRHALAYLEDTYGDGPGSVPKDAASHRAHGVLMHLLTSKEFMAYVDERTK